MLSRLILIPGAIVAGLSAGNGPPAAAPRPALAAPAAAIATSGPAARLDVQRSRATGFASFLTIEGGGALPVSPAAARAVGGRAAAAIAAHGHLFGVRDLAIELREKRVDHDALGFTHTTFEQVHFGVPVFSGMLKVHEDAAGQVRAINGDFYPISPLLDPVPVVDERTATATALDEALDTARAAAAPEAAIEIERAALVVVDPGWYGDPPIGARLAWYVVVRADAAGLRDGFFIDARTGEVLDRWDMTCALIDRAIYDAGGLITLPGTLERDEGQPPSGDTEVDAAYDYIGDVYGYYFRAFGRDSIDDAGATIVATTHTTFGGCPNARWTGQQLTFCTGTAKDDIAAHETAHGVTQYTADLIFQNQSGMLNESFSDVFGELVDLFNGNAAFAGPPSGTPWPAHPTGPGLDTPNGARTGCSTLPTYSNGVRWLIGEGATVFGGLVRDMWDPVCLGMPPSAMHPLLVCQAGDAGGVHFGSSVPNHCFAILTDGDNFNGYTITGIGPIKSGAVWYRALTMYMTVASDFLEAYGALNQAAADLVGTSPNDPRTGLPGDLFTAADAIEVDEALIACEMNTDGLCGEANNVIESVPPDLCDGATVVHLEDFESGAPGWTVFNTNPPTAYDWELTTGTLPFVRPGVAWFCPGLTVGNCISVDESAVHTLTSPVITMPALGNSYVLSFTHYFLSQGKFDGGTVELRVNGGPWITLPRERFEWNGYNGRLSALTTNPNGGETAFLGAGGQWGETVINLFDLVRANDDLEVRFEYSRDGCLGVGGWYVDDVRVLACPDCDNDGISDLRETLVILAPEPMGPIGESQVPIFDFDIPRPAVGDVFIRIAAYADLRSNDEFIDLFLNFTHIGRFYEVAGADCNVTPEVREAVMSAAAFNAAVGGPTASFIFQASGDVDFEACDDESYVTLYVRYESLAYDADLDDNGVVGFSDITLLLLAVWGPCTECPEDIDDNGVIGFGDLTLLLLEWGICP